MAAPALLVFGSALAQSPDTIYTGAHIITVDEQTEGAEAVALQGERIVAVGDRDSVLALATGDTRIVQLGDQALLPGFIDSHGHALQQSTALTYANLQPPPVGAVDSIDQLKQTLTEYISSNAVPAGQWVVGFGCDDSLLAERRHPDRDDLDAVSRDHPIIAMHVSGHLAAVNSLALQKAGFAADTKDPDGGVIRRRPGSNEPNGVLEESAAAGVYYSLPQPGRQAIFDRLSTMQDYYASHGLTTIQEGGASEADVALLRAADEAGLLALDIVDYFAWRPSGDDGLPGFDEVGQYGKRLKFGGIKMWFDGSPQGKTACLSEPYYVPPPRC